MKALFVGLGSIAKKHLAALRKIVPECEIYALRSGKSSHSEGSVIDIFSWEEVPNKIDFILISNPTSEHFITIQKSLAFHVPLFIEKPPLMSLEDSDSLLYKVQREGVRTYTAFNFRFHPVINWLKSNLKGKRVLEVQVYCGSYLPDWRPGRDYKQVYSAIREMGGGVHLDLIHEIDYILSIFGHPTTIVSSKKKLSNLLINSADFAHYHLEYHDMQIFILLNYYRRDKKRTIEVVTEENTFLADLLACNVRDITTDKEVFSENFDQMDTYYAQMNYFISNLNSSEEFMNSLHESVQTLKICLSSN